MFTFTCRPAALALTAALLPLAAAAQTKPAAAKRPEVGQMEIYRDDKQGTVGIVRLGPRQNKQALVELAGFDHPWNKRVFKAAVVDMSRRAGEVKNTYWIQVNGKPWGLVAVDLVNGGLMLNLLENGDSGKNVRYPLSYDKTTSAQDNPEALLTGYLAQEANPKTSTARYTGKPAASR